MTHATAVQPSISVIVQPDTPPRRRSVAPLAVWAVVLIGIALRGYCYARDPSFWIDEAMLAVNVVERSPAGLLEPLRWNQGAPVGFLLVSKLAANVFGPTEYALRLVPLLAGLAGFTAFVPLAYRVLPTSSARLAVGLFAVSPYLAGYCAEFKQYESDAALAVLLTLLARSGRLMWLALAGAVGVWFSHPAVFVLGGVGSALLADVVVRKDRPAMFRRLVLTGVWVASFAACYVYVLRPLGTNDYLREYWAGKFLPLPPVRPGDAIWLVQHFFEFFQKPGGMHADAIGLAGLAGFAYLVGVRVCDWRTRVLLVGPMLLALLASGFGKYPFANRLLLFAVPAALLLVARGTVELAARINTAWPGFGAVFVGLVCLAPVTESFWLLKKPLHAEDAREALATVSADWQPGDRLYVFHGAAPAWEYYRDRFPIPAEAVRVGATPPLTEAKAADQSRLARELAEVRGKRVWVLLAHQLSLHETAVRAHFGDGAGETVFRGNDALVVRFGD